MEYQRTRLEGKVAIVTGAGATGSGDFVGIGQAISILFARNGAKVLLVDRNEENVEATLATIKEEGGDAFLAVRNQSRMSSAIVGERKTWKRQKTQEEEFELGTHHSLRMRAALVLKRFLIRAITGLST